MCWVSVFYKPVPLYPRRNPTDYSHFTDEEGASEESVWPATQWEGVVPEQVSPQSLHSSPLPGSGKLGRYFPIIGFHVLLLKSAELNVVRSRLSCFLEGQQLFLTSPYLLFPLLGQSTVLNSLDLQEMLPQNLHDYYSYKGSISSPPCFENVRWFVLADSVKLSRAQVMHGVTSPKFLLLTSWLTRTLPQISPDADTCGVFHEHGCCASPTLLWVILPVLWQGWANRHQGPEEPLLM